MCSGNVNDNQGRNCKETLQDPCNRLKALVSVPFSRACHCAGRNQPQRKPGPCETQRPRLRGIISNNISRKASQTQQHLGIRTGSQERSAQPWILNCHDPGNLRLDSPLPSLGGTQDVGHLLWGEHLARHSGCLPLPKTALCWGSQGLLPRGLYEFWCPTSKLRMKDV